MKIKIMGFAALLISTTTIHAEIACRAKAATWDSVRECLSLMKNKKEKPSDHPNFVKALPEWLKKFPEYLKTSKEEHKKLDKQISDITKQNMQNRKFGDSEKSTRSLENAKDMHSTPALVETRAMLMAKSQDDLQKIINETMPKIENVIGWRVYYTERENNAQKLIAASDAEFTKVLDGMQPKKAKSKL